MADYCIDAHTLIWHLEDNARLSPAVRAILNATNVGLFLPAIALAEALYAVSRGKTGLGHWREVLKAVRADPRLEVVPLSTAIIERALSLAVDLEMHDAQIVATALELASPPRDIVLLTRDREITQSGLVAVIW